MNLWRKENDVQICSMRLKFITAGLENVRPIFANDNKNDPVSQKFVFHLSIAVLKAAAYTRFDDENFQCFETP